MWGRGMSSFKLVKMYTFKGLHGEECAVLIAPYTWIDQWSLKEESQDGQMEQYCPRMVSYGIT